MLFAKKTSTESTTLKDNFDALNDALFGETPGTAAYQTILDQLKTVNEMLSKQDKPWEFKPSADTLLNAGVSVLLAVAVLRHEQLNVITSKVWGFLPKLLK